MRGAQETQEENEIQLRFLKIYDVSDTTLMGRVEDIPGNICH